MCPQAPRSGDPQPNRFSHALSQIQLSFGYHQTHLTSSPIPTQPNHLSCPLPLDVSVARHPRRGHHCYSFPRAGRSTGIKPGHKTDPTANLVSRQGTILRSVRQSRTLVCSSLPLSIFLSISCSLSLYGQKIETLFNVKTPLPATY